MTSWRVVALQTHAAHDNMAIDEAVSEAVADGRSAPTIRFYRWRPSAVSVGYFQSLEREVDLEECRAAGVDYVRRRTGGGAVYHDYEGEVTYTVVGPLDEFPEGLGESYRSICGRVVDALASLGVRAEFQPVNDVVTGGRKISGNAQTRRMGVLLQHGTVLHRVDPERMFTYLRPDVDKVSDKLVGDVRDRVTSVEDQVDADLHDTYLALRDAFTAGRDVLEGGLTQEEVERARALVETRYSTDEWSFER